MTDGDDNPGVITSDLCMAYRQVLEEKINGLRNQIVGAIALSTAVISIVMYLLKAT